MAMERRFLPYGRQHVEADDIDAVAEVLRSDFLTTGPVVDAFEDKLSEITHARFAISLSSGTAALHLAALALDFEPGDIVVVPTMTFLATVNAALYAGAESHFTDVDPETGLITAETLERALSETDERARAVFPVHINGQTVDMNGLAKLQGFSELGVVEDACHALGGKYTDLDGVMVPVGCSAVSDLSVFSFHPVKSIAMGEGGAITTNDAKLAQKVRTLRNIGITREPGSFEHKEQAFNSDGKPNPWYYEMTMLGFNYRASALHCALGLSQLSKLSYFVEKRSALVSRYQERLKQHEPAIRPLPQMQHCEPAWHLFVALIDFQLIDISRADTMRELERYGVGTQVHYIPVHHQPYYRKRYGELHLPGADAYYAKVLSLPLFVSMTEEDVDYVVDTLVSVLGVGG